ncbi:uncharacterized protein K441DRAFT_181536 [Cenococcum geophilum 1.58]|uniref:uncharacterized protein n=1 Tax=Cenococcum geophilum 1.58 TaxID=794803 RepID=UPI00358E7C92|nr:hypothetical protein K441DRAFT_181536 [Cenococcum geophilum 1.58]
MSQTNFKAGNRAAWFTITLPQGALRLLVGLVTLLYYRFFNFNTLKPIEEIAKHVSQQNSLPVVLTLINRWRTRKRNELEFITIACVAITAIITASFSWSIVPDGHWIASALWFASLTLSICGIFLSAQQIQVLILLDELPEDPRSPQALKAVQRYLPQLLLPAPSQSFDSERPRDEQFLGNWTVRWKMVFTWQCPMMFTAYSFLCYLIGLTVLVGTPLLRRETWGPQSNIAVIYLGSFVLGWGVFIYCSLWGYQPIDLDDARCELSGNAEASEVSITSPTVQRPNKMEIDFNG